MTRLLQKLEAAATVLIALALFALAVYSWNALADQVRTYRAVDVQGRSACISRDVDGGWRAQVTAVAIEADGGQPYSTELACDPSTLTAAQRSSCQQCAQALVQCWTTAAGL